MTAPIIATLPAAPSRTDPDNFSIKADALVAALANFVGNVNGFGSYLNDNVLVSYAFGFGTASAPSIHFDGDSDTGFFRPSSNNIGISTNGVQRVQIDGSGRVGIGDTSPSEALSVTGNISATGSIIVGNNLNITGPSPKIRLTDDDVADEYSEVICSSGALVIQSRNGLDNGDILFRGTGDNVVTEYARFKDSGYFGLGTTSPNTPLEILTSTANSAYIRVGSSRASNGWSVGDDIAGVEFYSGDGSGAGAGVRGSIRYKVLDTDAINTAMAFHTAEGEGGAKDVERMRLTNSGNLNLGGLLTDAFPSNNTSGSGITLRSDGRLVNVCDGLSGLNIGRHTTEGNVAQFYYNGVIEGSISITETSTSYNTTSDYRLKTDAQPMVGASDLVQALNPVNFEWLSNGTRVNGFLAHEVQVVVPEAVTGTQDAMQDEEYEVSPAIGATYDDEGTQLTPTTRAVMGTRSVPEYQSIDQSKLVPLLTAALKEALTKIEAMETRIAALEE